MTTRRTNKAPFKPNLENDRFHTLTVSELLFTARDAHEAAKNFQGWNATAECKYLDQVNDACSVMAYRLALQDFAEQANG